MTVLQSTNNLKKDNITASGTVDRLAVKHPVHCHIYATALSTSLLIGITETLFNSAKEAITVP